MTRFSFLRTKDKDSGLMYSGIFAVNMPSLDFSYVLGEYWSLVEVSNARGTFAALHANQVSFLMHTNKLAGLFK